MRAHKITLTEGVKPMLTWPEALNLLKQWITTNVRGEPEIVEHVRDYVHYTDEFHPIDNDSYLSQQMNRAAVDHKSGNVDQIETRIDPMADAVYYCLEEMAGSVVAYYRNPMNFAPGYRPQRVTFGGNMESDADIIAQKILGLM